MINGKNQTVGEGAIAVQTEGAVTVNHTSGISTDELRAAVTKEFQAEFFKLLGLAGDIATARAEKVVEKFIDRIEKTDPTIMQQASEPDFRHAIFTAQKATARAGDENLEELLVELLVQRGHQAKRNLLQIVLNESLEAVGLLTDEQVATLTLAFLIRSSVHPGVADFSGFVALSRTQYLPYLTLAASSSGTFDHLVHARCGTISMGSISLAEVFQRAYPGLWQRGIPRDDPAIGKLQPYAKSILVTSEHAPDLLRVNAGTEARLQTWFKELRISVDDQQTLTELFSRPKFDTGRIREICTAAAPHFTQLFKIWDETEMKHFSVSNIGIAIGHANISRTEKFDALSTWIK
jgi:hypothetical protein